MPEPGQVVSDFIAGGDFSAAQIRSSTFILPGSVRKEVSLSVLRLDQIHPYFSGNKWFKLKYNLKEFFRREKEYLLTFGGAWSNHLLATAAASKRFGIKSIGIVRGEELNQKSNPVLAFAAGCGMELVFVSRDAYRKLVRMSIDDPAGDSLMQALRTISGLAGAGTYILPEGGSNQLAVQGCSEIVSHVAGDFDFICCACGTGSTLAGISSSIRKNQKSIGIAVLKGAEFLEQSIREWNGGKNNFEVIQDYHFGGYAKAPADLRNFCEDFYRINEIRVEPVYTGKLFYGLNDLIATNYFPEGSRIVVVHSGGISRLLNSEPAGAEFF